ncbi:hypothetical protein ILUMI_09283 [Ignelater luminosus]|uniref:Cell division control protein n=1 Tax=Ignelater luminosus TaxID=2038154 RepID=A0A8K0GF75_IGNLU|nr:hypothetical protein ILUMI_09283 [Ignelater luminosus]
MTKSPVKKLSRRKDSVTLSSQTVRSKAYRKIAESNSNSEDEEILKGTTFPMPVATPTKRKPPVDKTAAVTPPKMQKNSENEAPLTPQTPSTVLNKLSLNSPQKSNEFEPKKLFNNQYQKARKALHSCVPTSMPGREKELTDLHDFINDCLDKETSGSLYISGPPGTGKTAALSMILEEPQLLELKKVFVNCTAIKSAGAIYARISSELNLKTNSRTEKGNLTAIESYLKKNRKMILLVLDEIDQLDSKNQSVLYTIFEWPAKLNSKLILIGIANALDLTDRILPRLQVRCELKPKLMHFAPYNKQQLVQIFTERLKESNVSSIFSPVAIQMLAGKVAAISGDVRRALDIGRRVVELAEQQKNKGTLNCIENLVAVEEHKNNTVEAVDLKQVVNVLNNVYGTSQNLSEDSDDAFPLQQKIIICSLLLILKKAKNKDITIGKLHGVYKKVCQKRNLSAVDQAEFVGLCSLVETRGIMRIVGKKETRLHKVSLVWDEEEVVNALKDKQLMSSILQDTDCVGKL